MTNLEEVDAIREKMAKLAWSFKGGKSQTANSNAVFDFYCDMGNLMNELQKVVFSDNNNKYKPMFNVCEMQFADIEL